MERGNRQINLQYIEKFFGFLCLPIDHPDPNLRGMGLGPDRLTLAWLTMRHEVESFLDFQRLRSGAHNGATKTFILSVKAMLHQERGWLWLHPELLHGLPEDQQRIVSAAGGWKKHCDHARLELKEVLASLKVDGEIKKTREPTLAIKPILDSPEPLRLIHHALKQHRLDLEARFRPNEIFRTPLAAAWRDHLLISFLARFPLRAKHWCRLTYKEDGSGSIQFHPQEGWRLVIPYDDFKNVQNREIFALDDPERVLVLRFSEMEALRQLIPLLEYYLAEVRPVISGESDFLFTTTKGRPMSVAGLHVQVKSWTQEYLSQYSTRNWGIKGVHPFGPHAFRDIVATHIIKTTGSISLTANILLDSEDTVREHYARYLPEDRVGLAMAEMASAFRTDGTAIPR